MFILLFRHTAVVTLVHRSAVQNETSSRCDLTRYTVAARKMKLLPDATKKKPLSRGAELPLPGSRAPTPEGVPSFPTPEGVSSLEVPWVDCQWRPTYHLRAQTPWPGFPYPSSVFPFRFLDGENPAGASKCYMRDRRFSF